jgi:hypothetical protein
MPSPFPTIQRNLSRGLRRAGLRLSGQTSRLAAPIAEALGAGRSTADPRNPYTDTIPETSGESSLFDPTDADSELTPLERGDDELEAEEGEYAIVKLLESERLKEAIESREVLTRQWLYNLAMSRKHQWLGFNKSGQMVSRRDAGDPYRTYSEDDFITPILQTLVARDVEGQPEVGTRPLTASRRDHAVSDQCRALLATTDRDNEHDKQIALLSYWRRVVGQGYMKVYANPKALAPVPVDFDPETGEVAAVEDLPVGKVCREIINPLFVFYDPKADCEEEANWVIHAEVRSLSYIRERYEGYGQWGKNAAHVSGGDVLEAYLTLITSYLTAQTGNQVDKNSLSATHLKNQALVIECYEKPSKRYKTGRLMVVAGGRLVRHSVLPERWRERFPIVPLWGRPILGSLYCDGVMTGLVNYQMRYNEVSSRIQDRINSDVLRVVTDKGAQIGVDAFTSPRNMSLIYRKPGATVDFLQPPAPNQYWFVQLDLLKQGARDYAGVHEVSNATVPAGVTAAAAIELLQQADKTQHGVDNVFMSAFLERLGETEVEEWREGVLSGMESVPRLVGMSEDTGEAAWSEAMTFEEMGDGGKCRIVANMASGVQQSPVSRQMQAEAWYGMGLFGPAGTPEAAKAFFDYIGDTRGDQAVENIQRANERQQQQQMEMIQAEAQARAGAAPSGEGGPMPEDPIAKGEADAQVAQVKAQADTEGKLQLQEQKARLDAEVYRDKVAADLEAERARAGMGVHPGLVQQRIAEGRMQMEGRREQNRMAVEGARLDQQGRQQDRSLSLAERQAQAAMRAQRGVQRGAPRPTRSTISR